MDNGQLKEEVSWQAGKPAPQGYMQDSQGRLVPVGMVSEIDKTRNDIVLEIVEAAEELSTILAAFKTDAMANIAAFVELSAEKFGVRLGGTKGNVQLVSFDGEYKILRAINETISFDERLQVAKELVDQCIMEWSQGSRDEIKALVNDAFYVDKAGKLNTNRILGLRRLNIADPKWKQAMDAISESIQVSGSKAYIRIYKRQKDGSYKQVNLDMAAL